MGEWIGLPGIDGARGYVPARSDASAGAVLLLHAWWGLDGSARRLADRLVAAGFAVVAPDLYRGEVTSEVADAETLAGLLPGERAGRDVLAGWEALGALAPGRRRGVLGLSLGASYALWLAGAVRGVEALVACYGTGDGSDVPRGTPVLGHFAGDDPYEPESSVAWLESVLAGNGCAVHFHRYPGAGHWFLEEERSAFHPAAAELAWSRTVGFLCRELAAA